MKTSTLSIEPVVDYPTSDGRPMAETDLHRNVMIDSITTLEDWFADDPMTYVSGNMLVFYEKGNKRKHVSPDVFCVHGIPKRERLYYLVWEEGQSLDMAIEITSKTTQREDIKTKHRIYRDILKLREYFLFDPTEDYLEPSLQGYRLENGDFVAIAPINGRLHSEVLGLDLERNGKTLRFIDPSTGQPVKNRKERATEAEVRVTEAEVRATEAQERANAAQKRATHAETENQELRQRLEELQQRLGQTHPNGGDQ